MNGTRNYEKKSWGESHFISNAVSSMCTYNDNGKPNAMKAVWGGISEETQIFICVDDGHKITKNDLGERHDFGYNGI